jgi:hypothetical protein
MHSNNRGEHEQAPPKQDSNENKKYNKKFYSEILKQTVSRRAKTEQKLTDPMSLSEQASPPFVHLDQPSTQQPFVQSEILNPSQLIQESELKHLKVKKTISLHSADASELNNEQSSPHRPIEESMQLIPSWENVLFTDLKAEADTKQPDGLLAEQIMLCEQIKLNNKQSENKPEKKSNGKPEIIKQLVDAKAVNIRDKQGYTPLMRASLNGQSRLAQQLIAINQDDKENINQALLCAVYDEEITRLLLEAHADVELKGDGGFTALGRVMNNVTHGLVSFNTALNIVRLLLSYGASINLALSLTDNPFNYIKQCDYQDPFILLALNSLYTQYTQIPVKEQHSYLISEIKAHQLPLNKLTEIYKGKVFRSVFSATPLIPSLVHIVTEYDGPLQGRSHGYLSGKHKYLSCVNVSLFLSKELTKTAAEYKKKIKHSISLLERINNTALISVTLHTSGLVSQKENTLKAIFLQVERVIGAVKRSPQNKGNVKLLSDLLGIIKETKTETPQKSYGVSHEMIRYWDDSGYGYKNSPLIIFLEAYEKLITELKEKLFDPYSQIYSKSKPK